MLDLDTSTLRAIPAYTPSGKLGPMTFVLLLLTLALSSAMALVMYLSEPMYIPVVAVVAVAVPVFFAIWITIDRGRCRNPKLAVAMAVLCVLVYYAVYWAISYQRNVSRYGAETARIVELNSGQKGLPGYFVFRATKKTPPADIHELGPNAYPAAAEAGGLLNYLGFGAELVALVFIAMKLAKAASRRVFYEDQQKWAKAYEFQIQLGDIPAGIDATFRENWPSLVLLKRQESDFTNRHKSAALLFRVEYLPDEQELPVYVSLKVNRLGLAGRQAVSKFGGEGDYFVKQQPLSSESTKRFLHYFIHEMKVGSPVATAQMK